MGDSSPEDNSEVGMHKSNLDSTNGDTTSGDVYVEFAKQQKMINFVNVHESKSGKSIVKSQPEKVTSRQPINLTLEGIQVKFDMYGKPEKPNHANIIWQRP